MIYIKQWYEIKSTLAYMPIFTQQPCWRKRWKYFVIQRQALGLNMNTSWCHGLRHCWPVYYTFYDIYSFFCNKITPVCMHFSFHVRYCTNVNSLNVCVQDIKVGWHYSVLKIIVLCYGLVHSVSLYDVRFQCVTISGVYTLLLARDMVWWGWVDRYLISLSLIKCLKYSVQTVMMSVSDYRRMQSRYVRSVTDQLFARFIRWRSAEWCLPIYRC